MVGAGFCFDSCSLAGRGTSEGWRGSMGFMLGCKIGGHLGRKLG